MRPGPVRRVLRTNVILDGLLYPVLYGRYVDEVLPTRGGTGVTMLAQFQSTWFDECRKWLDAVVKTTAAESADNAAVLAEWAAARIPQAREVILPVARLALGAEADAALEAAVADLAARLRKAGVDVTGGK